MNRRPIKAVWTGASFAPEGRDLRYCQHMFGAGEIFVLDPEQERDMNSHRHYFAQLKEAWRNLPERLERKYPTEEVFRKKLLVEAGYFHEDQVVCDSLTNAATIAAFMAPMDPSSTIVVRGKVIIRYTAMSQSVAAMGRSEFQKSKWAVLSIASALIDVTPKQLAKHAEKSDV